MSEFKTFSGVETLVVFHYKDKIKLLVVVEDKDIRKVFNFINTRVAEILNPQRVVVDVLKEFNSYLEVCDTARILSLYPEERMIHLSIVEGNKVKLYSDSIFEVIYDFF